MNGRCKNHRKYFGIVCKSSILLLAQTFKTPENLERHSVPLSEVRGNYNMFLKHLIKLKQAVTLRICVESERKQSRVWCEREIFMEVWERMHFIIFVTSVSVSRRGVSHKLNRMKSLNSKVPQESWTHQLMNHKHSQLASSSSPVSALFCIQLRDRRRRREALR